VTSEERTADKHGWTQMGVNRQDAKKMRERTDWERRGEVNRRWTQMDAEGR
jgi:hypothetical protein